MAEKRFMIRQWEEIKKAGGLSVSIETITDLLERKNDNMLTRKEVLDMVAGYFNSCLKVVEDEDTGEMVTTWAKNPTKSGLAIALGISKQTLLDYVQNSNSQNKPYREIPYAHRRIATEDFDILCKAYAIIENFYEEQLAMNKNNAGVIYWLNNASNTKWSNEQEFRFDMAENRNNRRITTEELPKFSNEVVAKTESNNDCISSCGNDLPKFYGDDENIK